MLLFDTVFWLTSAIWHCIMTYFCYLTGYRQCLLLFDRAYELQSAVWLGIWIANCCPGAPGAATDADCPHFIHEADFERCWETDRCSAQEPRLHTVGLAMDRWDSKQNECANQITQISWPNWDMPSTSSARCPKWASQSQVHMQIRPDGRILWPCNSNVWSRPSCTRARAFWENWMIERELHTNITYNMLHGNVPSLSLH